MAAHVCGGAARGVSGCSVRRALVWACVGDGGGSRKASRRSRKQRTKRGIVYCGARGQEGCLYGKGNAGAGAGCCMWCCGACLGGYVSWGKLEAWFQVMSCRGWPKPPRDLMHGPFAASQPSRRSTPDTVIRNAFRGHAPLGNSSARSTTETFATALPATKIRRLLGPRTDTASKRNADGTM